MTLVVIAGCGFQPLYRQQTTGVEPVDALRDINVLPIPERVGQILRIELANRLTPTGAPAVPAYLLAVDITERKQDLGIREDATATRANLILTADFSLLDAQTRQSVFGGSVRSANSYNILDADFATLSAEADARRRAARDLAIEIESRLGIFLAQPPRR